MSDALLVVMVSGLIAVAGVLMARESSRHNWQHSLAAYALRLPRGLEAADVAAFLTTCTGLRARRGQRPFVVRAIVLEVTATSDGIIHHLFIPAAFADIVLAALRAAMPGVVAGRDELYSSQRVGVAAEIGQSGWRKPLVVGQAGRISAAMLAALQPLANGERIVVQWVLAPTAPAAPPVVGQPRRSSPMLGRVLERLVSTPPIDAAMAKAIRAKQASPLFIAVGRIGAAASTARRARALVSRVMASLHTANSPGAHLYRAWWPSRLVRQWIYERTAPLMRQPCLLNADELSGLVAWPLGEVSLPGLSLGGAKALAPSSEIPRHGRVLVGVHLPRHGAPAGPVAARQPPASACDRADWGRQVNAAC